MRAATTTSRRPWRRSAGAQGPGRVCGARCGWPASAPRARVDLLVSLPSSVLLPSPWDLGGAGKRTCSGPPERAGWEQLADQLFDRREWRVVALGEHRAEGL